MAELIKETRDFEINEEDCTITVTKTTVEKFSAEEYVRETTGIEIHQERNKDMIAETQKILDEFKVHLEKAEELKKKAAEKVKAEMEKLKNESVDN